MQKHQEPQGSWKLISEKASSINKATGSWTIADKDKENTFYYSRSAVALRNVGQYR